MNSQETIIDKHDTPQGTHDNPVTLGENGGIFARLYPVFKAGKITSLVIAGYFIVQGARVAYDYTIEVTDNIKRHTINYLLASELQQQIEIGVDKRGNLILKNGSELTRDELEQALAFNLNKAAMKEAALKDVASYVFDHVAERYESETNN